MRLGDYCRDRGRLRRRSGRGEVPGHQVPPGGPQARAPWWSWPRSGRLKHHGGVAKAELNDGEPRGAGGGSAQPAAARGEHHRTCTSLPCVVAINRFPTDTEAELQLVEDKCRELGVNVGVVRGVGQGRRGRRWPWPRKWCACAKQPSELPVRLSATTLIAGREARGHRHAGFTAPTAWTSTPKPPRPSSRSCERPGLRRPAGVHGQDAVQLLATIAKKLGAPRGLHASRCANVEGVGRRRLRGGADRRHHDHAGPAQGARRREHRRRRDTARSPACSQARSAPDFG